MFAHHIWATERLIEACGVLTTEQLAKPVPCTYGSIIDTLRHLVGADGWYLSFYDGERAGRIDEEGDAGLPELRAAMTANGPFWLELVGGELDPDADVVEIGDTGWGPPRPASGWHRSSTTARTTAARSARR